MIVNSDQNLLRVVGFDIQQTARADVLVEEALKTSAIEGETLDPDAVRSSVGRHLGIPDAGFKNVNDQKADGLVQKGILIKLPGGGRSSSYDLDWSKCREQLFNTSER